MLIRYPSSKRGVDWMFHLAILTTFYLEALFGHAILGEHKVSGPLCTQSILPNCFHRNSLFRQ